MAVTPMVPVVPVEPWIVELLSRGGWLASLLVLYLMLRLPAVSGLILRLVNGQKRNGAPKSDKAGDANVDFWRVENRKIVDEALLRHEQLVGMKLDRIAEGVERLAAEGVERLADEIRESRLHTNAKG